jgi:hypothetical protein
MNKILFTARLMKERDKFELLLNRVGFARQMTMKGVSGTLSVKDLLADILTREQFIADRMNEILHGETYSPCTSHTALEDFHNQNGYPDYESSLLEKEKPNHLVFYKHKNVGVDDIVEQELTAYENIIHSLEKLTLGQCLDHDLFHRISEHTYKPYHRATVEINRWLKSIASEPK